jgi:rubrerythrin
MSQRLKLGSQIMNAVFVARNRSNLLSIRSFSNLSRIQVISPGKYQRRMYSLSPEGQTILDHLLKTEEDAEDFYRELAAKAKNEGFKNIFLMLVKEEQKHKEWLKTLAADSKNSMASAVKLNRTLLGDAKNVFLQLKESRKDLNKLCVDQVELYRTARDIEGQSRNFYAERAKNAKDPELKKLLEIIAAEENKHFVLIDSLLKFISEEEEGYEVDALNFWVKMDDGLHEMGKP